MTPISSIINRKIPPEPWVEGEKIPWHEPGFSARMLKEHLNQDHDLASRRTLKIEKQVTWIHQNLLAGRPNKILDLGCGPGLYTYRLACLGHECTGVDFSPASIAYASAFLADQEDNPQNCSYVLADIRKFEYGVGFGLVMLIYGEVNVFKPADARLILSKAFSSLAPGGTLLLEPQTAKGVQVMGQADCTWYSSKGGLFSDKPHLCLIENFWSENSHTTTTRYYLIDAASGALSCFTHNTQAYSENELCALLMEIGFNEPHTYPSLTGSIENDQQGLYALVARKPVTA